VSWSAEWKPPLNSQINALKEKIHARMMNSLLQCGYKIQGDAQMLVPVDTGRLKTSVSVKMENEIVYIGTNVFMENMLNMERVFMRKVDKEGRLPGFIMRLMGNIRAFTGRKDRVHLPG